MYTSEQRKEKTFQLFKDLYAQRTDKYSSVSNIYALSEEETIQVLELAKKAIRIFDENYQKC